MNARYATRWGLWIAVLVSLSAAAQSLTWELKSDGQIQRGTLEVASQGKGAYWLESEAEGPVLHVAPAPGEHLTLSLGGADSPKLRPLHMYRVSADLRRTARTQVHLYRHDDPTHLDLRLPAIDYLVAPVWEELAAFTILPPDAQPRQAFLLDVANANNGRTDASVDLRRLRLEDLGQVIDLAVPRTIATWPRLALAEKAQTVPRVSHDAGSGMYQLRFTIETPVEVTGWVSLHQGDDPVRHWMTSTALSRTYTVPAGTHKVELLFPVADQRFVHQWFRFQQPPADPPAILTELAFVQLSTAPPAAAAAGPQSPSRR